VLSGGRVGVEHPVIYMVANATIGEASTELAALLLTRKTIGEPPQFEQWTVRLADHYDDDLHYVGKAWYVGRAPRH